MWILLATAPLAAELRPRCATLELLPHAPPLVASVPLAAATGEKVTRDAYALPNTTVSAHFAAHWGTDGGVDRAQVDQLLVDFEEAWAVQIEQMGHPRPAGTDTFRFNVYVGDTGDGAPSGYGAGGYYWVDHQGFPMVVISLWTLQSGGDGVAATAHHEFYHAIQGASARYAYEDPAAWYWEATAEWAAIETRPDNPANGGFLFGYLLLPELPANFFDYADRGTLEEYHQYGAFLLPHDLTRQVGWELVRDTWTDPGDEPDPLEVMRAWLAERGEDLDALWLDHVAHNAGMDYAQGAVWLAGVEQYASWYGIDRLTASTTGSGGDGRVRGDRAPSRYGANTIELWAPDAGTLTVRIEGDGEGTEGSPARFGARVVRGWDDGTFTYVEVPFEGTIGTVEIPDVGDEETIWLTVGAWTEEWDRSLWVDEKFPYSWSLSITEPEPPASDPGPRSGETPAGCGCGTGTPGGLAVAIAGLILVRRRR